MIVQKCASCVRPLLVLLWLLKTLRKLSEVIAILVADFVCDYSILKEAQRRFGLYIDQNDESVIPGDLRTAVFSAAVRNGGDKEYEKVLSVYRKPPTPQHKTASIRALTNAPTEELRKRTLDMILSDEVKTQDVMSFFVGASSYAPARRATWEYFKANYPALETRFKGNFSCV